MTAQQARATIAARLLPPAGPERLGDVVLVRHQADAVRRIATLLAAHGGALLADDVGLGKTFVALAVARSCRRPVIIAPAGLRAMWAAAMARTGVTAGFESYEALSRRVPSARHADLVILDEAHHARSPSARRYARIAALAAGARVLLLTATPVPNRLDELRHLFALFMGERARSLGHAELSSLIVRRTAATTPGAVLPPVHPPRWIEGPDDGACLGWLAGLPPPVPPADGGDGGALVHLNLVRQWASSRAALIAALRRRVTTAYALEHALQSGRMPTGSELRAWAAGDDSMQLAFPELAVPDVAQATGSAWGDHDIPLLLRAVRHHRAAAEAVLERARTTADPDAERADRIVAITRAHPGEKVICFTGFARTAAAYWRHLRHLPGVGRLWSRGGEIASGPIGRQEVLRRFAPQGQRCRAPRAIEDITLLVATDVLAEGVDLRDATVVVHLDLPWSPARMEQRVGRARRLGSQAAGISVYAMRPPAPLASLLDVESTLRRKIAASGRAVGQPVVLLPDTLTLEACISAEPCGGSRESPMSDTERISRLVDRVAGWRAVSCEDGGPAGESPDAVTPVAVIDAATPGWLGLLRVGGVRRLAASVNGTTGSEPSQLESAVRIAEEGADVPDAGGGDARVDTAIDAAFGTARHHACELAATLSIGLSDAPPGMRRRVLARIDAAYLRTPVHRRPRIARLAASARRVASGRLSAGMERMLAGLHQTVPADEAWLAAVAALPSPGDGEASVMPSAGEVSVEALVVFCAAPATGAVATPIGRAGATPS